MSEPSVNQSQPWRRQSAALFSNCPPAQSWFRCSLYCPRVAWARGRFHMWFIGTHKPAYTYEAAAIGYAQSEDGLHWQLEPANPILLPEDLPIEATVVSTPWVIYDDQLDRFQMWFGAFGPINDRTPSGFAHNIREKLLYAESHDGTNWSVHPEPLLTGTRAPCVMRNDKGYRMWINDRPSPDQDHAAAYAHVYAYNSPDGFHWQREPQPAIAAGGITRTCVYPSVLNIEGRWFMWHIGHLKEKGDVPFEIFCDQSDDGATWRTSHDRPAFAASRQPDRFDRQFVSAPCVVRVDDTLYLFHSASNLTGNFNRFAGADNGIGLHIAVATMQVDQLFQL